MNMRTTRLPLFLAGVLAFTACGSEPHLNILLISLDTTRADHLGCYGHAGISTPAIDRLAATGTLYENAITPAPITLPAHTSMLTGTYPARHGVRSNHGFYVPQELETLAEILGAEGYDTAAFVGAFPLDSQTGIDQGFDLYDDSYPSSLEKGKHPLMRRFFDERPAAEVTRAVLAWLNHRDDRPFFLWTHYFDPHQPLTPPAPYRDRYAASLYDGEIASVDEALGQVIRRLEEGGQLEKTIVILTADHGEGLGDHGEQTHALLLHSSTLRVPLIVRDPKDLTSVTVTSPVSTVDIFATVLARLGLQVPDSNQGVPLPRFDAEADPDRAIYSETLYGRLVYGWSPLQRLTTGSHTLIRGPGLELYERPGDPDELRELSGQKPLETENALRRLQRRRETLATGGRHFSRGDTSQESLARLAALGYLVGSSHAVDSDEIDPSRPNPELMMEVFEHDMEGRTHLESGSYELAVPVIEHALSMDSGNPALMASLARAHLGIGALEQARQTLEGLLHIDPRDISAHLLMARYHRIAGDGEQAVESLEHVVAIDPSDLSSRLLLAHLAEDVQRLETAEGAYRDLLDRNADHALAMNGLATLLYRRGDVDEAVELLEEALTHQPFYATACLNLGVIEYDRGEHRRSLSLAERALELQPGYAQALALRELALKALTASG